MMPLTLFHQSSPATVSFDGAIVSSVPYLVGGLVLGALYFHALWKTTRLFVHHTVLCVMATFIRFAVLAAILAAIARQGALPLLSAALGVLIARALIVQHYRKLIS